METMHGHISIQINNLIGRDSKYKMLPSFNIIPLVDDTAEVKVTESQSMVQTIHPLRPIWIWDGVVWYQT